MLRMILAVPLLASAIFTGCHPLLDEVDDCTTGMRNWCLAERSWCASRWCYDVCHKKDFGCGYKAGYVNVSSGGNGCPPPLPPRQYWCILHQGECGQDRTRAWYDGWAAGVSAATHDQVSELNRVFIPASRLPSQVGVPARGDIEHAGAAFAPPLDYPAELGPPPAPADLEPLPPDLPVEPELEAEEAESGESMADSDSAEPVTTQRVADQGPKPPALPNDDEGTDGEEAEVATEEESGTGIRAASASRSSDLHQGTGTGPRSPARAAAPDADSIAPSPPPLPVEPATAQSPVATDRVRSRPAVYDAYRTAGLPTPENPGLSVFPSARVNSNGSTRSSRQPAQGLRIRDILHAPRETSR